MPLVSFSLWSLLLVCFGPATAAEPVLRLSVVKQTLLHKQDSSDVMGAAVIHQEGYLLWTMDLTKRPPGSHIELYAKDGMLIRQIGETGRGPGKYSALQGFVVDDKNSIWVEDAGQARISKFGLDGTLLGSDIIMNPTFGADSILLKPGQGKKYLGGCLPKDGMPMKGCLGIVHEYDMQTGKFVRSLLSTTEDKERIARSYIRLQHIMMDSDTPDALYVSDRASRGFWIIELPSGVSRFITIPTLPILPDMTDVSESRKAWDTLQTISHIFQIKGDVYVGIRTPSAKGISSQILKFDAKGKFLAKAGNTPGILAGKTQEGLLLFTQKGSTGVTIWEMNPIGGGTGNR